MTPLNNCESVKTQVMTFQYQFMDSLHCTIIRNIYPLDRKIKVSHSNGPILKPSNKNEDDVNFYHTVLTSRFNKLNFPYSGIQHRLKKLIYCGICTFKYKSHWGYSDRYCIFIFTDHICLWWNLIFCEISWLKFCL